jgi:hypothetical protein
LTRLGVGSIHSRSVLSGASSFPPRSCVVRLHHLLPLSIGLFALRFGSLDREFGTAFIDRAFQRMSRIVISTDLGDVIAIH